MFLAPLLVPLVGRVSWWWATRQARGPVAARERRLRRELARRAVLWVHTGDLGLTPAHVTGVARSCGFAVAWLFGARDGQAMLLSRDSPGGVEEMARREDYRGGYPASWVLTCVAAGVALAAVLVGPVLLGPADDDTFLAAFSGGVAALFFTAALLFFGRFFGGRARRIRRVLGEFRTPRSVFVTLPAVGLDPPLVQALGEEMGFVFQGYDHRSRPLLRSMAFTPSPTSPSATEEHSSVYKQDVENAADEEPADGDDSPRRTHASRATKWAATEIPAMITQPAKLLITIIIPLLIAIISIADEPYKILRISLAIVLSILVWTVYVTLYARRGRQNKEHRPFLAVSCVVIAIVANLAIIFIPIVPTRTPEKSKFCASLTNNVGCVRYLDDGTAIVDSCDREKDGHKVWARYRKDDSERDYDGSYDPNGAKAGCGHLAVDGAVTEVAVCEESQGCSWWTHKSGGVAPFG